jgi:hypothetical protein
MDWTRRARQILRAELTRDGVNYAELARRLQGLGVEETERSIPNKMSRGTFPFTFFLQCMQALGKKSVTLDLVGQIEPKKGGRDDNTLPEPAATGNWLETAVLTGRSKQRKA